jgi:hypothetical protein
MMKVLLNSLPYVNLKFYLNYYNSIYYIKIIVLTRILNTTENNPGRFIISSLNLLIIGLLLVLQFK